MNIVLRADDANGVHTRFTVFVNGANSGQLCMGEDEAITFYMILQHGCNAKLDEFLGKGIWSAPDYKEEEDGKD